MQPTKGYICHFHNIAMCHQCHITKWEALTLSEQTPSGPIGDAALATSFIEACGQKRQRGFAQKILRAIKAFSVPRRRHECRMRREQVCICCHFSSGSPGNVVTQLPRGLAWASFVKLPLHRRPFLVSGLSAAPGELEPAGKATFRIKASFWSQ